MTLLEGHSNSEKIAELEAIIADYEGMLKQALERIEELNLRIALRDDTKSAQKSNHGLREYESQLAELRQIADLVSVDAFLDKEHTEAEYIRRLAKLRSQLQLLASKHHCKGYTAFDAELDLADLSLLIGDNCSRLVETYYRVCEYRGDGNIPDWGNDLIELTNSLLISCKAYQKKILDQDREITQLRKSIATAFDGETPENMRQTIENQASLIEGYKKKIDMLEFELSKK